jgi:predicted MFS family arabinose efflux permease
VRHWSQARISRFLVVAVFIATFDRSVVTPMFLGMAQDFHTDLATITLSASAYYFAYGLAQPVWGIISDRLGRTSTMRLALALAALADVLSVVPMPIEAFIVMRAVAGAAMAGVFPTTLIFIGDTIPDDRERQPAIARLMTGVAMGLTLGTVLGGIGIATIGWQAFFLSTAVASTVLAWLLRSMPNPRPSGGRLPILVSFRIVLTDRWPWLLYGLVFTEAGLLLGVLALIPSALESSGSTAVVAGAVTGAYGLAVLGTSMIVRRMSLHAPAHTLLAIGGTSATLGFCILAFQVSVATVLVSVLLQGVAWVFMHTTLQTWATTLSDRARATAVSLFAGCMFLGNAFGTFIAGSVLQNEGPRLLFGAAAILMVPLTIVATMSRQRYANRLG